MTWRTFSEPSA